MTVETTADFQGRPTPSSASPACRVGLLTYHFVVNYGAMWQAWALQKAVASLGHPVEFINYCPAHVDRGGAFRIGMSRATMRANLVTGYQKYLHLRSAFGFRRELTTVFRQFVNEHLTVGDRWYGSHQELRDDPPTCEVLVCGSDQVWNPSSQFGLDPAYFLDFAGDEIARVGYAPSFGRAAIPEQYYSQLRPLLQRFDALSVREASGGDIIAAAGVEGEVAHLPDPTLLIDAYPEHARPPQLPERYLFSYVLRSGENINQMQRQLADRQKLQIVTPRNRHAVATVGDVVTLPDPLEWLASIRHAQSVVTNSYHGTLFSIILQKPFVVVGIGSGKSELNERVISLLDRLDLRDRLLAGDDVQRAEGLLDQPVDWVSVRRKTLAWREQALTYLRRHLRSPA